MASTLVIKVQHNGTLRRFSALIKDDGELVLTMDELNAKILSLFSFPADAEMTLSYFDEDGDIVALVDDDDLNDITRQNLKFLRIDVHLNNKRSAKQSSRSSSSSTPALSPRVPKGFTSAGEAWNSPIQDLPSLVKTIPDPLRETLHQVLSNVCHQLASKASTSSHVANDVLSSVSKLGLSLLENVAPSGASDTSEKDLKECKVEDAALDAKEKSSASEDKAVNQPAAQNAEDGGKAAIREAANYAFPSCPFSGLPMESNPPLPALTPQPLIPPRAHNDAMMSVFHSGVQCDACGAHPIVGPRFKSKVKEDYDLCQICFSQMGNASDYERIETPLHQFSHACRGPFRRLHEMPFWRPSPPPYVPPFMRRPAGNRAGRSKLDSRFILDVNVLDGTVVAPGTSFTKIWRVRNNGNVSWPRGAHITWIGGDKLCASESVELEIPEEGLPVDKELDIAVDFTAPFLPGRYISYWRLASPSGVKFGQRVWVLIQVDAPSEPEVVDLSDVPVANPATGDDPASASAVSYPIIDLSEEAPAPASVPAEKERQEVEESLLKELEEMGFKQVDLNKEVLRTNQYKLEESVDALCGVAEWDPILEELKEMGFHDKEMNIKLLKKNNGSIKGVVLDLLTE